MFIKSTLLYAVNAYTCGSGTAENSRLRQKWKSVAKIFLLPFRFEPRGRFQSFIHGLYVVWSEGRIDGPFLRLNATHRVLPRPFSIPRWMYVWSAGQDDAWIIASDSMVQLDINRVIGSTEGFSGDGHCFADRGIFYRFLFVKENLSKKNLLLLIVRHLFKKF